MADKRTEVAPHEEGRLTRRESFPGMSGPFQMLERFADEMDRIFDDFGLGRGWPSHPLSRTWLRSPMHHLVSEREAWTPAVEVLHRNHELVVRVDLPGLTKDDVKVDVSEEGIAIHGERRREHTEEKEGVYRSERSYGSFSRMIPLPEGAIADHARATFKDGVLEITMPAPPDQVRRGRRLEITEGTSAKK